MAKNDTRDIAIYLASVKARGYENLKADKYSPNDPLLMDKLAADGHKLLAEDLKKEGTNVVDGFDQSALNKVAADAKKLETVLGEKSPNQYVRARVKVLGDMLISRRERIEKMERENNLDNPYYKEFIRMVIKLGDSLSS